MNDDDSDAQFASLADTDPDDIEYMFAQTAEGLSIDMDGRITLNGVSAATLWFSDRPYRLTGHVPTDEFVASWDQGDDSFAEDPPERPAVDLRGQRGQRRRRDPQRPEAHQW
jgi:hypothetical protein